MNYLYEYSDILNEPYEAFEFDTAANEFPVRSHFHRYVEMLCMTEGSMFVSVNEKEYYVDEGDVMLFFGGDVHAMYASSMRSARFMGIKFDANRLTVNSSYTPRLSTMLAAARGQGARMIFGPDENVRYGIEKYFSSCAAELKERGLGYDVKVHADLCRLLVCLLRIWQAEGIDFSDVSDYISADELSLQNILEYIDLHLDENLKVAELAKRCGMSYSHFAKSFRELYGRSCKEHLEILRIDKAVEMLKFTEYSLNAISSELGFADCSHFIRVFRKHKGVTPGSIRQEGR